VSHTLQNEHIDVGIPNIVNRIFTMDKVLTSLLMCDVGKIPDKNKGKVKMKCKVIR
jgi:hypothetical protein